MHPPPPKIKGVSTSGTFAQNLYITQNLYVSLLYLHKLIRIYMKKEMLASMVNRPISNGVTGIQAAVAAKKMRKREEKISMMVEADVRAEMREQMNEYMMGSSCR